MGKISRRSFLESVAPAAGPAYDPSKDPAFQQNANRQLPNFQRTRYTLTPYTGAWGEAQAIHLIRRTMFGVKPEDVATLKAMSLSQAVDYLLDNPAPALAPPVNNYTSPVTSPTSLETIDNSPVAPGQTWVNAVRNNDTINGFRKDSMRAWWISQMVRQNLSIQEKMIFFWHHMIPTGIHAVNDARYSYKYYALLSQHATGNYRTLVRQMTTNPAMLVYLNGTLNTSTAPDENYGRELQELFTVGKFPTQGYSEADVKSAAKVLTGWKVDAVNITATFNPLLHDISNKRFSAFYGNQTIMAQGGAAGANETDTLINMIFEKRDVARYLCRRLYRFFVYYTIDSSVETNVIEPLAQLLIDSNFEVKPVLRTLLKSEYFWDTDSMGCFIKTPLDFVVGMMRQFDVIQMPPEFTGIWAAQYAVWLNLYSQAKAMGLNLGDPPNVSGWPAYYQTPEFYELWINSATLPFRAALVQEQTGNGFQVLTKVFKIDPIAYASKFSNPEDPDFLVDKFILHILGTSVSAEKRSYFKSILLSGQVTNGYWTSAWNNYKTLPVNSTYAGIVRSRLNALITELLKLAEHQLS